MPTHSGPNIVDNGLVLSLDAADNNSFRGEPTTNLVTNTPSQNGWAGTYSLVDSSSKTFTIKTQQNNSNNTSAWRTWYWDVSSYVGSYITISGDIEFVEESNATFLHVSIGQGNTGSFPYHIAGSGTNDRVQISTKPIQKISVSWSGVINATGIVGFTQWIDNVTANGAYSILKVSNILIEAKSYKTRFVNGTRGTTVVTGGGWKDLSGNSNHGQILNGVTTSNDQTPQGALEFDGVNDYLSIGSLGSYSNFTLHIITKRTSTPTYDYESFIFSDGQNNGNNRLGISTNFRLNWRYRKIDGSYTTLQTGTNYVVLNELAILNITYDGTDVKFYKNGNLTHTFSSISFWTNFGGSILLGRNSANSAYYNGNIYNFKLYNRALTPQEIQQNYNSQKSRFGL